jgi:hypothetical protein
MRREGIMRRGGKRVEREERRTGALSHVMRPTKLKLTLWMIMRMMKMATSIMGIDLIQ